MSYNVNIKINNSFDPLGLPESIEDSSDFEVTDCNKSQPTLSVSVPETKADAVVENVDELFTLYDVFEDGFPQASDNTTEVFNFCCNHLDAYDLLHICIQYKKNQAIFLNVLMMYLRQKGVLNKLLKQLSVRPCWFGRCNGTLYEHIPKDKQGGVLGELVALQPECSSPVKTESKEKMYQQLFTLKVIFDACFPQASVITKQMFDIWCEDSNKANSLYKANSLFTACILCSGNEKGIVDDIIELLSRNEYFGEL
jgi:hypothetical protein